MSWLVVDSNDVRESDSRLKEPLIETILRVGRCLSREFLRNLLPTHVIVFVGPGNNGNDGLSLAKALLMQGFSVKVCNLFPTVTNEVRHTLLSQIPKNSFVSLDEIANVDDFHRQVAVDAIFGVGQRPPLPEIVTSCLEIIKKFPVRIALDVPTGINADSGNIMYELQWSKTLCVQAVKQGVTYGKAGVLAGEKVIVDCGIPIVQYRCRYYRKDSEVETRVIRSSYGHKYDYGPVGVIAGSKSMFGAAKFVSLGAISSGGSFVRLYSKSPRSFVKFAVCHLVKQYSRLGLTDASLGKVKSAVFGPGVDSFIDDVYDLLVELKIPVVVDAGALTRKPPKLNSNFVITPHKGEFERLVGSSKSRSVFDQLDALRSELNCNILLKGPSIIYKGVDSAENQSSQDFVFEIQSSKLSFGGVGDFLSGLIAGFLAQGLSMRDSCLLACYLLSKAADEIDWGLGSIISSCRKNVRSFLSDLRWQD